MKLQTFSLALNLASGALAATSWIVPGAVWTSTSGTKIDAHGGNIVKRGDTFYWVGQSASHKRRRKLILNADEQPYMYQSTDLLNWTPSSNPQASTEYMWRPKIAKPNGSFWLYGQVDRLVQPLVSSTMVGGYTPKGSAVSLPPNSYTYSDTGMFLDDDGTWYILTSADHNTVQINRINPDGSIGDRVNYLAAGAYEAPGLLKVGGVYFLIVSGKTGWRSNPNKMFWATSISGSWTGPTDIAPEAENTYDSQNTFELTVVGSQATTYVYMGDSWDSSGGPDSNYIWLPMSVNSGSRTLTLQYYPQWKVDVNTGVVSTPSKTTRYEAEHAYLSGRAAVASCEDCVSKRSVNGIDHNSDVVFRNVTGAGGKQWVQFHYTVKDREAGEAHVLVNDQDMPVNISSMNSRAGYHKTVPVELDLKEGSVNTIKFGVVGTEDFGVELDGIEVVHDEL